MMTSFLKGNGSYQTNWGGKYGLKKETFHISVLYPTAEALFEGKYYHVPNQWHKYLSQIYGADYMKPPPANKREDHKPEYIVFNTDTELLQNSN
jgi:phosphorylcholine metabolism protein LicD